MATSAGGAAAEGLNAGLRLGLDLYDRQRQRERQDRLDSQAQQDRAFERARLERKDRLAALEAQRGMLAAEGEALVQSGNTDPSAQEGYTRRVQGLDAAMRRELGAASGYDLDAETKAADVDLEAIKAGDLSKLKPGQFSRAITAKARRAPSDYLRIDGKPALVEQAASDFMDGMNAGDEGRMLSGLNVLLEPDLRKGVGEPSPHGGVIVGKRIVGFIPAPNSTDEDPRVMPVLRVYVGSGKPEGSGDEVRARRAGAGEDAPPGATGHYDAPITEDRSSRPDAKVKSIGMREGMEYIGKHLQLVQLLNTPEAAQLLEQDAASGWNPKQYLEALSRVGVRKPQGLTVKDTPIPRGGSILRTTTDGSGRVVDERQITSTAPAAAPAGRPGTMQQQIDAIDGLVEDGTLTPEEGEQRKRALAARVSTGTKAQGLSSGGTGGGTGGGEDSKARDRRLGRLLQDAKERRLSIENKKAAALAEYKETIRDASRTTRERAKAEYDATIKSLDTEDAGLRKRMQDIEDELEQGPKPAARPGLDSARPGGARTKLLTKDEAAKAFAF